MNHVLQASCRLNHQVFQVISKHSQAKYNQDVFFDCKLLSSSSKSTHHQVSFASFHDLKFWRLIIISLLSSHKLKCLIILLGVVEISNDSFIKMFE